MARGSTGTRFTTPSIPGLRPPGSPHGLSVFPHTWEQLCCCQGLGMRLLVRCWSEGLPAPWPWCELKPGQGHRLGGSFVQAQGSGSILPRWLPKGERGFFPAEELM